MTHKLKSTPITTPWGFALEDWAAVYAASFGLFAPGLLMATRRQTIHTALVQGQST